MASAWSLRPFKTNGFIFANNVANALSMQEKTLSRPLFDGGGLKGLRGELDGDYRRR